jgi:hypothetical protein
MRIEQWDGEKIRFPGIYGGIPIEFYHSDCCIGKSISSSGLRTISSYSPAHYWATSYYNEKRYVDEEEETKALLMGRALHDMVFSYKDFKSLYVRRPETYYDEKTGETKKFTLLSKVCQETMRLFGKKSVLMPDDYDNIIGMGLALSEHPKVRQCGLLEGHVEHSMFWVDEETGVWLKSRPDAIPTDRLLFVDLKTSRDVRRRAIHNSIWEYGYAQQGALVMEGCKVLFHDMISLGNKPLIKAMDWKDVPKEFWLLFVEKTPPYATQLVELTSQYLNWGMTANREAIRQFAYGTKTGKWPGPAGEEDRALTIDMPDYAK